MRWPGWIGVVAILLGGCVEAEVVRCADGRLCPRDTVCDDLHAQCVLPAQLETCDDLAELDYCEIAGELTGLCRDGVCVLASCGDGVITTEEDCEPDDLDGVTDCMQLGFYDAGPVTCTPGSCLYDVTACEHICGDRALDADHEACDALPGVEVARCDDVGIDFYEPGPVTCTALCGFDTSACAGRCGDDLINGDELCDGDLAPTVDCVDLGFDLGRPACAFCSAVPTPCERLGWTTEPVAASVTFTAVWSNGDDDAWATTRIGGVAHKTGGTWTLTPLALGTNLPLRGVWASGPDDAWVVGGIGATATIGHWNGATWSQPSVPGGRLDAVWGAGSVVWAVGEGGTVLRHDAGGWQALDPGTTTDLRGVWGRASDDVYIVGDGGLVLHWNGAWSSSTPGTNGLVAITGHGPTELFAVGGDEALRWDGATWTSTTITGANLFGVSAGAADDVIAVGDLGAMHRWDGAGWTPLRSPTTATLNGVSGPVGARLAVGEVGAILHWEERDFTPIDVASRGVGGVWAAAPDDVYAVGDGGRVLHWDGDQWTEAAADTSADFSAVFGWGDGADAFAVGESKIAEHQGGWTEVHAAAVDLHAAWGLGPDDVYVAGGAGTILHRGPGGWTTSTPAAATLRGLWGFAPDDVFAVGENGAVIHGGAGGWTAQATPTTATLRACWGPAPDDVFAVGDAGTVIRYDGAAWTVMPTPVTATLEAVWGTGADDVFALGALGALIHFDGAAWTRVRPPAMGVMTGAWGTGRDLFVVGDDGERTRLIRTEPWSCRAAETGCADRIDDDCDGALDGDDADCAGALALGEVFGGAEPFVEVIDRSGRPHPLAGYTITFLLELYGASFALPTDAIVAPGGRFRAIADRSPGARERYQPLLEGHAGGWVALCAGPCDLATCANVVDYVELSGTSSPINRPACATFVPGPIDLTGLAADQGIARVGFAGGGAAGVAADWAIATATRD